MADPVTASPSVLREVASLFPPGNHRHLSHSLSVSPPRDGRLGGRVAAFSLMARHLLVGLEAEAEAGMARDALRSAWRVCGGSWRIFPAALRGLERHRALELTLTATATLSWQQTTFTEPFY